MAMMSQYGDSIIVIPTGRTWALFDAVTPPRACLSMTRLGHTVVTPEVPAHAADSGGKAKDNSENACRPFLEDGWIGGGVSHSFHPRHIPRIGVSPTPEVGSGNLGSTGLFIEMPSHFEINDPKLTHGSRMQFIPYIAREAHVRQIQITWIASGPITRDEVTISRLGICTVSDQCHVRRTLNEYAPCSLKGKPRDLREIANPYPTAQP